MQNNGGKRAKYWDTLDSNKGVCRDKTVILDSISGEGNKSKSESPGQLVKCRLCPQYCTIAPGESGLCHIRANVGGELISTGYGQLAALAVDPIEKKPLYHFKPGTNILSAGVNGCNMRCMGCQNYNISQNTSQTQYYTPEQLVQLCKESDCNSLAFTYTEPFVGYEFLLDTSILAKENSIDIVLVSNGLVNAEPLAELTPYITALNIDIKALDNEFYKTYCKAPLDPVLETCVYIKNKAHLEITNLLIPGLNDSDEQINNLVNWITENLGRETPLHLSAYFPHYQMTTPATLPHTMLNAKELAERELLYVYLGNVSGIGGSDTFCPECGNILIERTGYKTNIVGLDGNICNDCGALIPIIM